MDTFDKVPISKMLGFDTTSESLLRRIKVGSGSSAEAAWRQFVHIYTPLIFGWSRKIGLSENDAADLVQEVLMIAIEKLPEFHYDRSASFRGWLRTVTVNKFREKRRKLSTGQVVASHSILEQLQSVELAASTWDIDYARVLVAQAMELMRADFAESTWSALKLVIGRQVSVEQASQETGVSPWTIYSAKSRLMKRLRDDLQGLL